MTTPLYPQKPSTPAMTRYINIAASVNSTGYLVFEMNNRSTQVDYKYSISQSLRFLTKALH